MISQLKTLCVAHFIGALVCVPFAIHAETKWSGLSLAALFGFNFAGALSCIFQIRLHRSFEKLCEAIRGMGALNDRLIRDNNRFIELNRQLLDQERPSLH